MTMKIKNILISALFLGITLGLLGLSFPMSFKASLNHESFGSNLWLKKEIQLLKSQARNIDEKVLRLALTAYMNTRKHGYVGKQVLTVIDYSKPSTQKRLWVFDLRSNRTLFNTWVSHGKNSGGVNSNSFSNSPGSLKSSLGVFVTDTTYSGKNGYSLRLRGLEHGVNDSAYSRAIVVHGAAYANGANAGRDRGLGRSWGCPAVSSSLARPIINTIKDRTVIFAYYPDRKWLSHSSFLSA
jgi:hypothetical protein